jgi:hypothetical protein
VFILVDKQNEVLFKAIGEIDENILIDVENNELEYKKFRKFNLRKIIAFSLIAVLVAVNLQFILNRNPSINYDDVVWSESRIQMMSLPEIIDSEVTISENLQYLLDVDEENIVYGILVSYQGLQADVNQYFYDNDISKNFDEMNIIFLTKEEIYKLNVPENIGLYFELANRPIEEN